ncbi:methyltransferase domain-containing protein [Phytomonospora sp. NPDC050363]|uniref:SAM-dependent methyltransferase n=1 Tax=Phytomonospora sp. NPDC050363 TaxID=3155642 RepID=UPI0033DA2DB9
MNQKSDSAPAIAAFYDNTVDAFDTLFDGSIHTGYWAEGASTLTEAQRALTDLVLDAQTIPSDGGRLLDLGCGQGGPALYAAERLGVGVFGVTLSPAQARLAKATAEDSGASARAEFHVMDMSAMSLPDASFDGAYAMESVFHVADKTAAFTEILRVLKPGATLAIADYHLIRAMPEQDLAIATGALAAAPLPTLIEWLRALEEAGFEAVESRDLSLDVLPSAAAMRQAVVERAESLTVVVGAEGLGLIEQAVDQYARIYTEDQGFALFTARKPG